MEILVIWFVLAFLVAVFASRRGRSPIIAFILSIILSPILMFIYYAAVGESVRGRTKRITEEEKIRAKIRKELEG